MDFPVYNLNYYYCTKIVHKEREAFMKIVSIESLVIIKSFILTWQTRMSRSLFSVEKIRPTCLFPFRRQTDYLLIRP